VYFPLKKCASFLPLYFIACFVKEGEGKGNIEFRGCSGNILPGADKKLPLQKICPPISEPNIIYLYHEKKLNKIT